MFTRDLSFEYIKNNLLKNNITEGLKPPIWPNNKSWVNVYLDATVREGNTWVFTQSLWKITV